VKSRLLHITFFLLLFSSFSYAQVSVKVDTTHIRIGEQIQYEIVANNSTKVIFPKLQMDSLGKVEVVHSLPVDTIKNRLYKKYLLTSFDSGVYQIPGQEVLVNASRHLTDSLLIRVGTVAVDTTKQKLFPIKPILKAAPKTWHNYLHYLWWVLGVLLLAALVWWFAFKRKKAAEKKASVLLSPIEEALSHFKTLDKKGLVEQKKIKEYYVELTEIVREYIGKDVQIPTLEVTTEELITLLSIHNKSNKLGIDKERITQLHQFLQQADLVKFAKAKPEYSETQEDRKSAETIISEIQTLVHKPVLDEFGNEVIVETEEEIQEKTSKKRKFIGVVTGLILALLISVVAVSYYGYAYVKDSIIGHPTKELLEGDWYHSSYGYPAIGLEAPKVLKAISSGVPPEAAQMMTSNATFAYGSLLSGFYVMLTTVEFNDQVPLEIDAIVGSATQMLENQEGVSDFSFDSEEITINDISGKKLIGKLMLNNEEAFFKQFVFINENAVQQIAFVRKKDDLYAAEIEERMEKSIQLQKITSTKEK